MTRNSMHYLNNNAGALQFIATAVLIMITTFYVIWTRRLALQPERDRIQRNLSAYRAVQTELNEILQCCDKAKDGPVLLPIVSWEGLKGELDFASLSLRVDTSAFYGKVRRCNGVYERWANEHPPADKESVGFMAAYQSPRSVWVRDAADLIGECRHLCERYREEEPSLPTKKRGGESIATSHMAADGSA